MLADFDGSCGVAAQVDLLANVGALLADTQMLLTRLQDDAAASAEDTEDDSGGFFAAADAPGREPSPAPGAAAPAAAAARQAAEETATDEVYEFQARPLAPACCFSAAIVE